MRKVILLFAFLIAQIALASGRLQVVASNRDMADFASQVGGALVDVTSLANGLEDLHNVLMKPSMITRLAKADLFIAQGLDLEHAYAPALLAESRNPKIQWGKPGYLDASAGIPVLDVPASLDRSEGDQHAQGNPHYNLDPERCKIAVRNIAKKLAELDPAHAADYAANADRYAGVLDAKLAEWRAKLAGKQIKFITYHPDFAYFADRFGVDYAGTIQPKPGIEPGPRSVESLIQKMKDQDVKLILKESFFSDRFPREIADRTGARLVSVPVQTGALPGATNYVAMVGMIVDAVAGP